MEDQLATLRKRRSTVKARLTNFKNYLIKLKNTDSNDMPFAEIESRLENASKLLVDYESTQDEIDCKLIEVTPDELQYRIDFEDNYYESVSVAKQYLSKSNQVIPNISTLNINQLNENLNAACNIRLPVLELPRYGGEYDKWMNFHDTFNSLVINNATLSNIQKFHFLKSCIHGQAEKVISSLQVSADNFDIAWQLICDRYANNHLLVYNHTKALFDMPVIYKEHSSSLRQLIDDVNSHLRSLKALKQPTEYWDTLLIYMIVKKLDSNSVREWELASPPDPSLNDLMTFLKRRSDVLEKIEVSKNIKGKDNSFTKERSSKVFVSEQIKCQFCRSHTHKITNCSSFLKLNIQKRIEHVKKSKWCYNCFYLGHTNKSCSYGKCQKCGLKHHTLIHLDTQISSSAHGTDQPAINQPPAVTLSSRNQHSEVILSTVLVEVIDSRGKSHLCRALLDCASQSNFITEELFQRLGLPRVSIDMSVSGIGQSMSHVESKCSITVRSRHSQFSRTISCLLVKDICGLLPNSKICFSHLKIPQNIQLADPSFLEPSPIQLLIGASIFWELLSIGQIRLGNHEPILQKTRFGWVVSGPVKHSIENKTKCFISLDSEFEGISKFWEVEDVCDKRAYTKEELHCEEHFLSTFKRNHEGRFVVSIPFKKPLSMLGDTKQIAIKRFLKLERKLNSDQVQRQMYSEFIREYIELNHMSEVNLSHPKNNDVSYFLPHHSVYKQDSSTTKLRVVFDASCASTSGVSLNDIQSVGPVIQSDLLSILLRFRQHLYVVGSDIAKMYRCIEINPDERNLQMIYWRFDIQQPLRAFQLNTVTYGTASASFLATRCLLQLSNEFSDTFPKAARVIQRDFYMDDLLTGSDDQHDLKTLCNEVKLILDSACFPLRKWVSNSPAVISDLSSQSCQSNLLTLGDSSKTLGLLWHHSSDELLYNIESSSTKSITKRTILSEIARVFDPLGLLSPCTIKIKMLIQKLWSERLGWDECLPMYIHTEWTAFKRQLPCVIKIKIQRCIKCPTAVRLEIHGFCDASQSAYGCCIYVRSIDSSGNIFVRLLSAKSKVAPLKPVSLPRLELCGALILSRLFHKVMESMDLPVDEIYLWSDSTIVLGWVRTSPNLLKTFVCNRITEITTLTENKNWYHVGTKDNPADLLTRGLDPSLIESCDLWWKGPAYLYIEPFILPAQPNQPHSELPDRKNKTTSLILIEELTFPFERFSNFSRLLGALAYCRRFVFNSLRTDRSQRKLGPLSIEEVNGAEIVVLRIVQNQTFKDETVALQSDKPLSVRSKVLSLNPFIDANKLLRVGGRLRNSSFPEYKVHPILLPAKHYITKLIFRLEHVRALHCGVQQLLYLVREKYWPVHGRNIAKLTVRTCNTCFKANPRSVNPLMSDLPSPRVHLSFPFANTGVDYAGPFLLKDRRGRGCKTFKAYVSLFICLSTKAIHLELVSELSTAAFLSAFKRFIARRGMPETIYSDNGKNFVGASNELKALGQFLSDHQDEISASATYHGLSWKFIPSYSPHMGGIWEVGVKSMKAHLKRVIGNSVLTYEDFQTVLVQIEGILNSRPISPLSTDPTDLNPLTPAHFLLGRPSNAIPEADITQVKENALNIHQRLQAIRQHIWKRWSLEYVSELQQRQKWKRHSSQIKLGDLVLIKDKSSPPLSWPLGRVVALHPGSDGITRVVSIDTSKGITKRAVTNICPLPCSSDV